VGSSAVGVQARYFTAMASSYEVQQHPVIGAGALALQVIDIGHYA
jgi:hypothetical protein